MIPLLRALFLTGAMLMAATPLYAQQLDPASDLPQLGDPNLGVMSPDGAHRLGRSFLRSLRAQTPIMEDPLVQEYAESLVYRLASFSDIHEPDLAIVVIDTPEINAFAVPGGVIGLNAGLFLNAASDDEVAAVIAHELGHVSQHHFARRYVESKKMSKTVLVAMLASIALAIAGDGQAGMAGIAATQAGAIQSQLAYSRSNEREADRIGMQTLARAGMNPMAMPRFFEKMLERQRFNGEPPEFLLTHPVTEERIADTLARARNLPHPDTHPSLHYELVRARVQTHYFDSVEHARAYFTERLHTGSDNQQQAARYGLALTELRDNHYNKARQRMTALSQANPNELWYDIGLVQIDVADGAYPDAIRQGRQVLAINPQDYAASVLVSRAYLLSKQPAKAIPLLEPLLLKRPGDPLLWSLDADARGNSGDDAQAHRARAEKLFLDGHDEQAFKQMKYALHEAQDQFVLHARISARLDSMKKLAKESF